MNFKRLRYFAKVVDVGSLTQAADLLYVAQPALSQQIATLEAEVRQTLLVRTKRGVTPTEAGKTLYRHAQLILGSANRPGLIWRRTVLVWPGRCRSAWRRERPRPCSPCR
jgi:DNA-binding transcriptional LysR family regulator